MTFALCKLHAGHDEPLPIPQPNGAKVAMKDVLKTLLTIALWAVAFYAVYVCMIALLLG